MVSATLSRTYSGKTSWGRNACTKASGAAATRKSAAAVGKALQRTPIKARKRGA